MARPQAIFNGTDEERLALLAAVERNCECQFDLKGSRTRTCAAHDAMVHEQRFLDGLLMMRRLAEKLLLEEFR